MSDKETLHISEASQHDPNGSIPTDEANTQEFHGVSSQKRSDTYVPNGRGIVHRGPVTYDELWPIDFIFDPDTVTTWMPDDRTVI